MAVSAAVARRYAQAYFDLAEAAGAVTAWRDALADVVALLGDARIAAILRNPRVPRERRARLVADVLDDVPAQAQNLARLLVEHARLAALPEVLDHYDRLADRASGVVRAEVTTAVALDPGQRDRIAQTLSQRLGGEVHTTLRQDPQILGGLVIRIGDRVIDGSVRARLEQLQAALA